MPNLTSVERLARFYEDDRNYFAVLMIKYSIEEIKITVKQAHFVPIEFLAWECLTVGALGWGQIQISNANVIRINQNYSRKEWMLQLCEVMLQFYRRYPEKCVMCRGKCLVPALSRIFTQQSPNHHFTHAR